jgi:hypothetical protein
MSSYQMRATAARASFWVAGRARKYHDKPMLCFSAVILEEVITPGQRQ